MIPGNEIPLEPSSKDYPSKKVYMNSLSTGKSRLFRQQDHQKQKKKTPASIIMAIKENNTIEKVMTYNKISRILIYIYLT